MQKISDIKCQKTNTINNLQSINSKMLCKDGEPIQIVTPDWPQRVGCKQITSRQKPPHLRSKVRKHLYFRVFIFNLFKKLFLKFSRTIEY